MLTLESDLVYIWSVSPLAVQCFAHAVLLIESMRFQPTGLTKRADLLCPLIVGYDVNEQALLFCGCGL